MAKLTIQDYSFLEYGLDVLIEKYQKRVNNTVLFKNEKEYRYWQNEIKKINELMKKLGNIRDKELKQ